MLILSWLRFGTEAPKLGLTDDRVPDALLTAHVVLDDAPVAAYAIAVVEGADNFVKAEMVQFLASLGLRLWFSSLHLSCHILLNFLFLLLGIGINYVLVPFIHIHLNFLIVVKLDRVSCTLLLLSLDHCL